MRLPRLSTFEGMKTLSSPDMVELTPSQLASLQRVLREALDDISAFCERESIGYTLSGGSILGSLRHGGFIPWDDDADLFMFRKDFERFAERFPTLGNRYVLESPRLAPELGLSISRIRIAGTVARLYNDVGPSNVAGVSIDIFVLENTYENSFARTFHGLACLGAGFLHSCRRFARDRDAYLALSGGGEIRTAIRLKAGIGTAVSFLSVAQWTRVVDWIYSLCRNSDSTYVSCPSGRKHYFGEMYLRSDMEGDRWGAFEGRRYRVPRNAEKYLEGLYGNWCDIPDESEREKHGYLAFDLGDGS